MSAIVQVKGLNKIYEGGFQALNFVDLEIMRGEVFALLGPNGAGKTTLISILCGLANPSDGDIKIDGKDLQKQFRAVRSMIGLVPQELTTDAFETVWDTVNFSRGLFGLPKNPSYIESVLDSLSLLDKKDNRLMTLSGGMKRRVLIAKALSHEPKILFLDEPTAGVDVELRKSMWDNVRELKKKGVTIILTTHYIEEAEEMADRVGVINKGKIVVVEEKSRLMANLGTKKITFNLKNSLQNLPESLQSFDLKLKENELTFVYDGRKEDSGVSRLIQELISSQIEFKDLKTEQSSLEEIFVDLVHS